MEVLRVESERFFVSVQLPHEIRSEIGERVKRRWWQSGEIDKNRWRVLDELITGRVSEAKENLERAILCEIRTQRDENGPSDAREAQITSLRQRSWKHLENGELDESQHDLITRLLAET